jgi:serine/threonine protein kinase/Tfp pilus assembly protein PilF
MASQQQFIEQLFEAALDIEPAQRSAYLANACRDAPELLLLVEDLLLQNALAGSFLEKPPLLRFGSNGRTGNLAGMDPTASGEGIPLATVGQSTSRFKVGEILSDRFVVVRFIARGGMGEVYEVEDHLLDNVHVALKMILPKFACNRDTQKRFQQEVLLARKVTHPNLCPIYDIFHCDEPAPPFSFLTMRLLPGRSLAERLAEVRCLPPDEAKVVFRQAAEGLAALHEGGIIHRDIKPNNLMLDRAGPKVQLWITDFGLAMLDDPELTRTQGVLAGTRGYFAPELLLGEPPSKATDIYAFGVVMHESFVGERPRVNAGSLSVVASPRLKSGEIPTEAARLVTEFVADDPKRRCIAFQQALEWLHSGSASASSMRSGSAFWTRRRFVGAGSVAACAVAGGVRWKWDEINDRLHPLPLKRFVAVLNWPASDSRVKPILEGVIDAIGSELARAEAFDRDLLVISPTRNTDLATAKQLDDVRKTLGANLVLAASGVPHEKNLHLSLAVLDPSSGRSLRERKISWPIAEPISLPDKAVRAAAELLNVDHYQRNKSAAIPDTQSSAAYAAFQSAEAYRKQDNDAGLNAAIDKYKEAIELDPRYATAHAKLAMTYLRFYFVHGDSAALNLAHGNADTALSLNPNLIEGHIARSLIQEKTGDKDGAVSELRKALAIDPGDPRTLVYQGQLLTDLNRWTDAEEIFARVVKLRPNYWLGHEELGVLFNAEGKYPEAVTEFRTASLAAPKSALPLNNLGSVYLQQGRIAEAKMTIKRCLDLSVNDSAEETMAAALRCEGKPAEAIPFCRKAVELDPTYAGNWMELGDCYSLLHGHRAEALEAYARAASAQEEELRDDPKNGPGWMVLALSRVKAGIPDTGLTLIDKAEQCLAGDLDSQLRKARTLELLGRRDNALVTVADCVKRGATKFQFQTMPDMGALRDDPRYKTIIDSMPSTT